MALVYDLTHDPDLDPLTEACADPWWDSHQMGAFDRLVGTAVVVLVVWAVMFWLAGA